jgi:integrase
MHSGITFRLFLLKRKQKSNGEIPVYLRITKDRKYRLISTAISVPERQWNESSQTVRKSHPRHTSINARLDDILAKAKETVWDMPDEKKSIKEVKTALTYTAKGADFFSLADQHIQDLHDRGAFWEWKHVKVAIRKLKEYTGKESLNLDELDLNLLEGFRQYLFTTVGNSHNTVEKELRRIRQVVKKALKQGLLDKDPFQFFVPTKRKKSDKARLALEQVRVIEALDLPPDSWLEITRDAFMFSFYNAGIRFGDIARLQWKHIIDGRLKYNMSKTGTGKNIHLLKPALAILDKYRPDAPDKEAFIFPILKAGLDYSDELFLKQQISSKNVIVNRNLKILSNMAQIEENVSFHVARHSFADYARTSGMDIYNISKALGHADITITQSYLKSFDETSLDKEMNKLFGQGE